LFALRGVGGRGIVTITGDCRLSSHLLGTRFAKVTTGVIFSTLLLGNV
jgi:tetrahydromethanopterin S-methyltransferase subunit F